jgi:hypothetical protein
LGVQRLSRFSLHTASKVPFATNYAFVEVRFLLDLAEEWLFPVTAKGKVDAAAARTELAKLALASLNGEESLEEVQSHIIAEVMRLNYGQGSKNPMESVGFFARISPSSAAPAAAALSASAPASADQAEPSSAIVAFRIAKEHVSALLPARFEENTLRVFCTSQKEEVIAACRVAFDRWVTRYTGGRSSLASSASHAAAAAASSSSSGASSGASGRGGVATPAAGSPFAARRRSSPAEAGSAPATTYTPWNRPKVAAMSPIMEMNKFPAKRGRAVPKEADSCPPSSSDSKAPSPHRPVMAGGREDLGKRSCQVSMSQA